MTKCVLIVQLEISQIPHNLFGPNWPMIWDIFEKNLITCPLSMDLTRALVPLLFNRTNSSESASLVCLGGVFQAHHYGRIFEILSKKYLSFLLSKSVKSRISEWKKELPSFLANLEYTFRFLLYVLVLLYMYCSNFWWIILFIFITALLFLLYILF